MAQVVTLEAFPDGRQEGGDKGLWQIKTFRYTRGAGAGDNGLVVIDPASGNNAGKGVIDGRGASALGTSIKNLSGGSRTMITPPTPSLSLLKSPGVAVAVGDGQNLNVIGGVTWPASLNDNKEAYRTYLSSFAAGGGGVIWVEFEPQNDIASTWDISLILLQE